MMEALPATALIMAEADFLLEVVIIALDAPARLGEIDEAAERHVAVDGCEPEFGGRGLALGHSMSSVSSVNRASPRIGATRTRAKRDCSGSLVPSRQVMVRQACLGSLSASASTLTRGGFGLSLRTGRTLTLDPMAAT